MYRREGGRCLTRHVVSTGELSKACLLTRAIEASMGSRFAVRAATDDGSGGDGGDDDDAAAAAAAAAAVAYESVPPLSASQVAALYLYGVEFAVFSMVLGYGQVAPSTNAEHLFASAAMLLVMGPVYAYAIGSLVGIISNLDPVGAEFRTAKDIIKTWGGEAHFSPALQASLLEYLDGCRETFRTRRYLACLAQVASPAIRGRVFAHLHGHWLRGVPFFACDDARERRDFTTALADALALEVVTKAEVIAPAGVRAERLYVIHKGVVAQAAGLVLCAGRYFGEEMMLRRGRYRRTHSAVTLVTCHVLHKRSLHAALATGRYPRVWR